eukprot:scaffold117574_cov52-Attheya_sp.AAC.2
MNGPANKDDGAQDGINATVPAGIVLAVGTGANVISNCEICSIEQRNHDEPPLEIPCSSCGLVGGIGTSSHSWKTNSQQNVSQAVELIEYDNSDDSDNKNNKKGPAGITCSICLECFSVGDTVSWSRDNEECNHPFHHDCYDNNLYVDVSVAM